MEYYKIGKHDILDHFEYLSSSRLEDIEMTCDTKLFLMSISCLKNIPGAPWFTTETITEAEQKIIRNNLAQFVINFTSSNDIDFELVERDCLSGLVLFRLDIIPVFRQYIDPDFDWIPMMLRLCYWEQDCKRRILDGIAAGNFAMMANNMPPITAEVPAVHRWWNNDYVESDDRIHLLKEEYELSD